MYEVERALAVLDARLPDAYQLRRRLHRFPDLSGDEAATRDAVLAALPDGSVTKVAATGAVVRIGGPGSSIALRGEMDALPVQETTGASWTSSRDGVMHACGHDVHLAALVAVARTVVDLGTPLPLVVVLQPREETYPSGARDVAEHGILEDEACAAIVGVHVQPSLPAGIVACVPGGVNASSDEFSIEITGMEGHAAYPHLASDPVLALADLVVSLQQIVSRSIDPMSSAVVGVSRLVAGDAANIIPGHARAQGTIRTMDPGTRALVQEQLVLVSTHVARAHGCEARVELVHGEPVLHNDPALVEQIQHRLAQAGGDVSTTLRSLGADDFAFFSERIPAAMMFAGTESREPLHSGGFLPSEQDVRTVARAMLCGYLGAGDLVRALKGPPSSGSRG